MKISDLLNLNTPVKKPKLKQKKWIPPLQQMLNLMKSGSIPANNLPQVDLAISLSEDSSNYLEELTLCEECGHLNIPSTINEQARSRLEEKWDKLRKKMSGSQDKCDSHK